MSDRENKKNQVQSREQPDYTPIDVPQPNDEMAEKVLPMSENTQNTIVVAGEALEIKPTLFKYMRNKTAEFYRVLEIYPVDTVLQTGKGVFDEHRSGDKCVFDWLVAATNDLDYVKRNYEMFTPRIIHQLLEIFKRLNHITEKEEALKKAQAQGKEV